MLRLAATALAAILAASSPRWSQAARRYVRGDDLTGTNAIVASAARTTSSNTGALDATAIRVLSLLLDVTAASGTTPTLDVVVEESDDGGTTWRTVGSFAQKTGVAQERKSFLIAADTYRVRWTLGGTTPNFTFSVSGSSKTG